MRKPVKTPLCFFLRPEECPTRRKLFQETDEKLKVKEETEVEFEAASFFDLPTIRK